MDSNPGPAKSLDQEPDPDFKNPYLEFTANGLSLLRFSDKDLFIKILADPFLALSGLTFFLGWIRIRTIVPADQICKSFLSKLRSYRAQIC